MKRGEQAKLIRELVSEHGFEPGIKMAISKLVTAKDYRIHTTPKGLIKIPETVKALINSGFGDHSKKVKETLNAKKGKPAIKAKSKKETSTNSGDDSGVKTIDVANYVVDGKLKTTAPRTVVELWKSIQSAEKDRIKNERDLKKLVDFNATSDAVFNFLRPFRDDILDIGKRISAIAYQAGSKQKAQKAIDDEVERIFKSRVGDDYKFDDELKKKITKILLMSLRRQ